MVDDLIVKKQRAIINTVHAVIARKRKQSGLSQLIENAALGKAALSMSESLITTENPLSEQFHSDYTRTVKSLGYPGAGVGVVYYRKVWPLETPNELIAQEIADLFIQQVGEDHWEDWGCGISRGFETRSPTEFCMCVVQGLGYLDGNSLVAKYVNEERVKAGTQPLEVNYHLRRMARNYLAMDTELDKSQLLRDLSQCDYAEPMSRVRSDYSGVYAPLPVDRDGISLHELTRLVANEFLSARGDVLLRSDWQDVGFAVKLDPVLSPMTRTVPSIMAEYVIAWHLPPNASRPTHFPPPIGALPSVGELPRKRRVWWWPF